VQPYNKHHVNMSLSQFEEDLDLHADDGLIREFDGNEVAIDIPFNDLDIPGSDEDAESGAEKSYLLVCNAHSLHGGLCTCKSEKCNVPGNHPCSVDWSSHLEECTTEFIRTCKESHCNIALATGMPNRVIVLEIPSSDSSKYLEFLSRSGGVWLAETFTSSLTV